MKEVRFGIMGLGGMGRAHVGFMRNVKRARITGFYDVKKDHLASVASEFGVRAFENPGEMFSSGEVDAVLIATPHYDHTALTVAALDAGIHVLCEKPIAVHKADAEKMAAAAAKNPRLKFGVMFNMRTEGIYIKIKQMIDSGEFGEIFRVNWIVTSWFRSQAYYNSGGWRATWKGEGGGVLLNQCPHNLDLFQWFFGMPSKVRAFCELGRYHDIEVEDNVTAYCSYGNGATGIFIASTGEAPGTNRLEITADRGRVVVENGKILFNRTEVPVREFCMGTEKMFDCPPCWNVDVPYAPGGSQHQGIIQNFTDSILDGAPLIAPGEEGIKSVELANAMLYSSIKDETVEMPLDAKAYERLLGELIRKSKYVKPGEKPSKHY